MRNNNDESDGSHTFRLWLYTRNVGSCSEAASDGDNGVSKLQGIDPHFEPVRSLLAIIP